jgi:hypothetical protein
MTRPTPWQLAASAAFVVISVAWIWVAMSVGRAAGIQVLGIGLLAVGFGMSFCPSIPIYSGVRQIESVRGWAKAIVIAPVCIFGAVALFAA